MARNVTYALHDGLQRILQDGNIIVVRGSEVKELRPHSIHIECPLERLYVVPHRNNNVFAAIAEVLWVIAGRDDVEFLAPYLKRAPDFSDNGKTWRGAYGPRLRNWQGVDQFQEVARLLNEDPNGRRAVMSIFDPAQDYVTSKDIPCNNWLHFMIRNGRLHLHIAIRSNDVMWGFSGINTVEWSVLHEMMALWTGTQVGEANYFISSFHLYDYHYQRAAEIIKEFKSRTLYDFGFVSPRFNTPLAKLDEVLDQCFSLEGRIREGDTSVLNEINQLEDPFLCACLQMLNLYQQHLQRACAARIGQLIQVMPPSDFKVAAIEYFTRHLKNRELVRLTPKERAYFHYFWGEKTGSEESDAVGFETVLSVLSTLHMKKTRVYKDSWKKRGEIIGVFANIARKYDRLETVAIESIEPTADESLFDTIADLAIYVIKYLTYLAEHYEEIFHEFISVYSEATPVGIYSDNISGLDALIPVLVQRYSSGGNRWLNIATQKDAIASIRRNYQELQDLLLNGDWRSSDPRKCTLSADLAISAVHCLSLLGTQSPEQFQRFCVTVTAM